MTTVRTLDEIVSDLDHGITSNGGVTVPVVVGQRVPVSGYAVGDNKTSLLLDYFRTTTRQDREIRAWLVNALPWAAATANGYVGAWLDYIEDTDSYDLYIDRVTVVHELAQAIELAKRNGELAIYDLSTGTEIRL